MDALSTAYDFVGLERIDDQDAPPAAEPAPRRAPTYRIETLSDGRPSYESVYEPVEG